MPGAALAAGMQIAGTMIGFDGEDYSSPAAFHRTGGFSDPATRETRFARLAWALERTRALGVSDLTLHVGTVPGVGDPARAGFLEALRRAGTLAHDAGVTLCIETGSEPAGVLAACLAEVGSPGLMVNFDPANLVGSGHGDPVEAVRVLGPYIRGVHIKDALPPGARECGERRCPSGGPGRHSRRPRRSCRGRLHRPALRGVRGGHTQAAHQRGCCGSGLRARGGRRGFSGGIDCHRRAEQLLGRVVSIDR